jgi:hypothetical protein
MSFARASLFALLALLAASTATANKIAVVPIQGTAELTADTKRAFSNSLAAELNKRGHSVLTDDQIASLLNQEAKQQWVGCTDNSCMAQLGEALGVDELALMSVSKVGQSWLVNVQRVDAKQVKAVAFERRIQNGSIDGVLDVLPALLTEAYGSVKAPTPLVVGNTNTNTTANTNAATTPANTAGAVVAMSASDVLKKLPVMAVATKPDTARTLDDKQRKRLVVAKSASGQVIAFDPEGGYNGPIFAGMAGVGGMDFYEQRIIGGGSDGSKFDATFWDPRHDQRGFAVDGKKIERTCGRSVTSYQVLNGNARASVLKSAKFFGPKWQRRLTAVLRDADLNYIIVDQARDNDANPDFRVFVGRKNAFSQVQNDDVVQDSVGITAIGANHRLLVFAGGGGADLQVKGSDALGFMGLPVEEAAANVYGAMGLYPAALGTLCDAH